MIEKLHFWCNKIIPLVYDEALSYYETVCKLVWTINETIKNVKELNNNAVFSVNGKTPTDGDVELDASSFAGSIVGSINGVVPDDEGAVTLNAEDVGALPDSIDPVESVNGISPDGNGNVNVGTVKSVNNELPDANGNVNLPTVAGVTAVDGIGPDGSGNVILGAVKSINGETPNAQGAVTLSANDVGALPDNYTPPVVSVNGETGAVNLSASDVGAMPDNYTPPVVSVNGETGAVNLSASDVGAMPSNEAVIKKINNTGPNSSGSIKISNAETPVFTNKSADVYFDSTRVDITNGPHILRFVRWKNVICVDFDIKIISGLGWNTVVVLPGTLPLPIYPAPFPVYDKTNGRPYTVQIRVDGGIYAAENIPTGAELYGVYTYLENVSNNTINVTNT